MRVMRVLWWLDENAHLDSVYIPRRNLGLGNGSNSVLHGTNIGIRNEKPVG